jgi:peptidoglycan/LPS O-acetylase OafA/YrhL
MGILTCQYRIGMIGARQYALLLAATTLLALWVMGVPSTLAGAAAVVSILFLQMRNAVFHFLGSISYSLYLLHSPIGRRALNVFLRLTGAESELAKIGVILLAVGVSIFAAYLLYRYVERPSQQWSASFRYHPRREDDARRGEVRPEELEQLNPAL